MSESVPLYHRVADQIQELILAGTLRAGDRVPSVRRLSRQQNISVSTVLEAYRRLEDSGVIEARPQSGFFVRRAPASVAEPESSRPPKRAVTVEVNALVDMVFSFARDPDVVAFGSACPSGELFALDRVRRVRSEEHTSELQSPCNLVCRLLLEKKKRIIQRTHVVDDKRLICDGLYS